MSDPASKKVILAVSGSIAAYKACEVASLLVKNGIDVVAAMTQSAQELVGPASLEGITGNRVITGMFDSAQNAEIDHIATPTSADLFVVAPATANIIAKSAHGIADDWITTSLLVTRAPILFAPAMNTNMYEHEATQSNIETLRRRGCHFVGPDSGVLACKTVGPGRMIDPAAIVETALRLLNRSSELAGKTVLITSGSNQEPIDPVRYIGNRSSGKMGRALAEEALRRGARVIVVTGPAEVSPPAMAEVVNVRTALEMHDAVMKRVGEADIVIGAAAVADYRLTDPKAAKHKRNGGDLTLQLTQNPDIIAEVGGSRRNGQIVIGFAAETENLVENARKKLKEKHLNLVVANQVDTDDSGFGTETIRAHFLDATGKEEEQPVQSKADLAARLFDRIVGMADA